MKTSKNSKTQKPNGGKSTSNSLVRLADSGLSVEQIGGRASLETGKIAVQVYARGEQVYDLDHHGKAFLKSSDTDTINAVRKTFVDSIAFIDRVSAATQELGK